MSNIFDSMISKNGEGQGKNAASAENPQDVVRESTETKAGRTPEGTRTPREVRDLTQELLRLGHLEESQKSDSFRKAIVHQAAINAVLEPLDLSLQLDEHRGVAFLKVAEQEGVDSSEGLAWSHPLVRRQRLTLEQSLLVAILRQAFVAHEQESGVGESHARLAVEDLMPQFLTYFEDSGSDQKNESRLLSLLEQLKPHGIVSPVDKNQEFQIRPMIAHLANPESLSALFQSLKHQTEPEKQAAESGDEQSETDADE